MSNYYDHLADLSRRIREYQLALEAEESFVEAARIGLANAMERRDNLSRNLQRVLAEREEYEGST